jgi:hypothetical protein
MPPEKKNMTKDAPDVAPSVRTNAATGSRSFGAAHAVASATTVATLIPLTDEAQRALGHRSSLDITHLPFKVGRETRSPIVFSRLFATVERRLRKVPELNDVYLIEPPAPAGFRISREHFAIQRVGERIVLIDRGSNCGTRVGDKALGGGSTTMRADLHDGDVITIGTRTSPYRYTFRLSTE